MEVMIESLLASKDLCNLADVLKYPPSSIILMAAKLQSSFFTSTTSQ